MKLQDLKLCAEQGCDEIYPINVKYCPCCLSEQAIILSNLGLRMNNVSISKNIQTLEIIDSFNFNLKENLILPLFL